MAAKLFGSTDLNHLNGRQHSTKLNKNQNANTESSDGMIIKCKQEWKTQPNNSNPGTITRDRDAAWCELRLGQKYGENIPHEFPKITICT